jgi:hypothetical protein
MEMKNIMMPLQMHVLLTFDFLVGDPPVVSCPLTLLAITNHEKQTRIIICNTIVVDHAPISLNVGTCTRAQVDPTVGGM